MKKIFKRLACCALAACTVFGGIPADMNTTDNSAAVYAQAAEIKASADAEVPSHETFTYNEGNLTYRYEITVNGNINITGYSGTDTEIVIPGEIDGKKVTGIDRFAFMEHKTFTKLTIPDSVTDIGFDAFRACSNLTEVTMPRELVKIDYGAFRECSSLREIAIPDSVTSIGDAAFGDCSSLEAIKVEEGNLNYKDIDGVLLDKTGEKLITCPGGKTGEYQIPEGVKTIESKAFQVCGSLVKILISSGVTQIMQGAFSHCGNLMEIKVEEGNINYKDIDGVLFDKTGKKLIACPGGKTGKYVIPTGVIEIGNSAFRGCALTEVAIQENAISIGEWAFGDCSDLTGITIPTGVTSIGSSAFWKCSSLTKVTLPTSITSIGSSVFYGCKSLTEVTIPTSVARIEASMFASCTSLTEVIIPTGVMSIENSAFANCINLTEVTIPTSVTRIDGDAFLNCKSLTEVTIPANAATIGDRAFGYGKQSKLDNFTILGYAGTAAQDYAAANGFKFIELDSSENPDKESQKHILNFSELEMTDNAAGMTFSDGYFKIGGGTPSIIDSSDRMSLDETLHFTQRIKLRKNEYNPGSIVFTTTGAARVTVYALAGDGGHNVSYGLYNENNERVGDLAVAKGIGEMNSQGDNRNCIVPSVFKIESAGTYKMYSYPSSTVDISTGEATTDVKGLNVYYVSVDDITENRVTAGDATYGYIVKNDEVTITDYVGTATELVIPSEIDGKKVTVIDANVFSGRSNLTQITLPQYLREIGSGTFENCSAIKSVAFPESLIKIGSNAFSGCSGIVELTIPEKMASIGSNAFGRCSRLSVINVAEGNTAFCSLDNVLYNYNRTNLLIYPANRQGTKYTIPKTVENIGTNAFYGCASLEEIDIPQSVKVINYGAFYGCKGLKSVEIPTGVTEINGAVFYDCINLKNVKLHSGITIIKVDAFRNCQSLEEIELPQSLSGIHNYAFDNCTALKRIEIPSACTFIQQHAFRGCINLTEAVLHEGLEIIKYRAFLDCTNLHELKVPKSVIDIGEYAIGSYSDWSTDPDFTIYGYENSAAFYYAQQYGINFVIIDDKVPDDTETDVEVSKKDEGDIEVTIPGGLIEESKENQELPIELDEVKITFDTGALISINHRHGNKNIVLNYKVVKEVVRNEEMTDDFYEAVREVVENGGKLMDFSLLDAEGNNVVFSTNESQGTVTVTVPYTAPVSANKVSVFYIAPDGTKTDMNGVYSPSTKTVTFTTSHFSYYAIEADSATDEKILHGDANCDNILDSKDVELIKKYLAGFEELGINPVVCDMNGDSVTDSRDVVLLLKKLAKSAETD